MPKRSNEASWILTATQAGPGGRDRPPAERPRALGPARHPARVRVEAQHDLARAGLDRRREPLAEPAGRGGHSSAARQAGRVRVARSVVTTTAPARTSERRPERAPITSDIMRGRHGRHDDDRVEDVPASSPHGDGDAERRDPGSRRGARRS